MISAALLGWVDACARQAAPAALSLRLVWLLSLLGKPTMFFDPLFGFCPGLKFAEVMRSFVWPRYFDAPMPRLRDRR
jgi:hypothetical protein